MGPGGGEGRVFGGRGRRARKDLPPPPPGSGLAGWLEAAVDLPLFGVGKVKPLLGPGYPHVEKAALLLQAFQGVHRVAVGQKPLLHPHQEDHGELQPLGVVQGHEGNLPLGLPRFLGPGGEGHLVQEVGEALRFPGGPKKLFHVLQAVLGILGIGLLEVGGGSRWPPGGGGKRPRPSPWPGPLAPPKGPGSAGEARAGEGGKPLPARPPGGPGPSPEPGPPPWPPWRGRYPGEACSGPV